MSRATNDRSVCTTTIVYARGGSYCVVDLTAQLWYTHSNLSALLLESWVEGFVLSMLKVPPAVQHSMQPHSIYWQCQCVAACNHNVCTSACCIFLGSHANAALAWQRFQQTVLMSRLQEKIQNVYLSQFLVCIIWNWLFIPHKSVF